MAKVIVSMALFIAAALHAGSVAALDTVTAALTSKATSAANPKAGGHHHHGTVSRSR